MSKTGQRIKLLREENNLTQEQFGKIFGMVKSTVSLYESGKSNPDDETKKKIADYFDVSIDWLLGRTDERNTVDKIIRNYKKQEVEIEELFDRYIIYFKCKKLSWKDKNSILSFLQLLNDRN